MLLLQRMEATHGKLFEQDAQCRVIFGDITAAHFFAELLGLSYAPHADTFTMDAGGKTALLPKAKLNAIIADWLRVRAAAAGIPCLANDSPAVLVIAQLKCVCVVEQLDEAEGLHLFLTERLERKAGASLTTSELFDAYREFCHARHAVPFPERRFLQRVTMAIREQFGLSKNHCVRRTDANGDVALKYGWRNLALTGA